MDATGACGALEGADVGMKVVGIPVVGDLDGNLVDGMALGEYVGMLGTVVEGVLDGTTVGIRVDGTLLGE